MDLSINERWLQFAFINSKGKLTKTALKIPFHTDLEVNKEYDFQLCDRSYTFGCESREEVNNNDGTIDVIYIVATLNQ